MSSDSSSDAEASAPSLYSAETERDSCGVGFLAHIKGKPSHEIVRDALVMLERMDHRGGCGCESNTGDGAGILTALPDGLFRRVAPRDLNTELPPEGAYAAGNIFLPQDQAAREYVLARFEEEIAKAGLNLIGWRVLPTDVVGADVGPTALQGMPVIRQLFVGAPEGMDSDTFERHLYLMRNRVIGWTQDVENPVAPGTFYVCSLSCRIIVYKGQLTPAQVSLFYVDLLEPDYNSHLAMVHSRFSTNTFPSWDRAQPCRMMSHNGEINTVQGNKRWIAAREGLALSEVWGDEISSLLPVVNPEASDSGSFDNVLEMLTFSGRSLPEAIMMMIPEAWENHESMPLNQRAFYEYNANKIEPWDGPASISFTDGKIIGACLDRNGLRPSRYVLTHDDRVIMASEVGVVDLAPENIREKGRLQPGRMFLVDFERGDVVPNEEIKNTIAAQRPYGEWISRQRLSVNDLPIPSETDRDETERSTLVPQLQAFGYTTEHLCFIMAPMATGGKEAIGSMGNDAALAVLSDKPRLLYDYFKQLFAQVTNPPIDPLREEIIMSLETFIGPEGNLLDARESDASRLHLESPVLTDEQLAAIKKMNLRRGDEERPRQWRSSVIDITYARSGSDEDNALSFRAAVDRVCAEADAAIAAGFSFLILSDRQTDFRRVPLPALLAVGALHRHLVANHTRTRVGLILESGEPREVHHYCLLAGYGCDAVNPYLALEALRWCRDERVIDRTLTERQIAANYIKAVGKGILKVMSKMGISTLSSYKGAQIFEALGLGPDVIDLAFAGTSSRLAGADLLDIAKEAVRRHEVGYPARKSGNADLRLNQLPNPGEYHWRPDGEHHSLSPTVIATLQQAARTNSRQAYDRFAELANEDTRHRCTIRGLVRTANQSTAPPTPIELEAVEPAKEIVKRFRTGAMSLGALSPEAHETLALAMNRVGGRSNSGEGGEDVARFALDQYEDGSVKSRRSSIKQIASGRFGVTSHYLANADVLQIKVAQGAKPGEGGQLPGFKVNELIARIRHSTPGVTLISPPPHHDIYSIEDLAQLIFDLKNANPSALVSVKLVSEVGVGTIAAGVVKAKADHILISGHDGGTGASPLTSLKHAGLPWELGLAETHQTLVMNDLRSRVRLETDGGFKTGRDVVIAAALGAEEFGFATAPMITIGCILMRKCHLNTCPVGVCTQDEVLRKKFTGTPEHVLNYLFLVAEEARVLMAELGVRSIDELVGRAELLHADPAIDHWKADGLDLRPMLAPAQPPALHPQAGRRKLVAQDHALETVLDQQLIQDSAPALERIERVDITRPVVNTDRAVGTMLSHEISTRHGADGLPDGTIRITLDGSAGQSLGAFLARGVQIHVRGDANDYAGKGLSGGTIAVYPPEASTFAAQDNIIIGNDAFYGATSGHAFFRGIAAERFAVRNSGAKTVVEGVGDHGCEYMTGGRVIVLGETGRNFAAGMSGGIAYVWDRQQDFKWRCNHEMVDVESFVEAASSDEIAEVRALIALHLEHTDSDVARDVLERWDQVAPEFLRVIPIDYRRVLEMEARRTKHGDRSTFNG